MRFKIYLLLLQLRTRSICAILHISHPLILELVSAERATIGRYGGKNGD